MTEGEGWILDASLRESRYDLLLNLQKNDYGFSIYIARYF